jgi:DNA polymerase/3'-5' exonuclease PolX
MTRYGTLGLAGGKPGMAHTYEELKGKTIDELREIAKGLEHEAVKGYTQLNKEHLLPALCKALGIEYHKHPHHAAVGIDKGKLKARMHAIKPEKQKAMGSADRKKLKALRREYHRLNRKIRAATV